MAAPQLNKRQLKRERQAVRPYSRSQITQALRQDAELQRKITAGHVELMPKLPPPWQAWAQQLLQPEAIAAPATLCSSSVLGMDVPLLQRFAAQTARGKVYVHSLSDAQALVFDDAGDCIQVTLAHESGYAQTQINDWRSCPDQSLEFDTQLRTADATALYAAWQHFARQMNCPANLSQFRATVFDAGLQNQRLVCISPISLDWMDPYANIHTRCQWFNGVSRIMNGAQIAQTMGHGRD